MPAGSRPGELGVVHPVENSSQAGVEALQSCRHTWFIRSTNDLAGETKGMDDDWELDDFEEEAFDEDVYDGSELDLTEVV